LIVQRRLLLQGLAALVGAQAPSAWARTAAVPGSRWDTSAPPDSGWLPAPLKQADAIAQHLWSSAVLVVHQGRVVHEFGDTRLPVNLYSGRKSVLSVLLGIEIDAGRLKTEATLAELGINDKQPLSATEQQATVLQLMQSRSGVYHPAAYETPSAKAGRPARGSHAPGQHWYYNNWDFNALATIYRQAAGRDVFQGLEQQLALPLQMEHFQPAQHTQWELERASEHAAYVMQLSARDWARVGLLMSRGGLWGERRIVSEAWVHESTRTHSDVPPGFSSYGLMWWQPLKAFDFWTRAPGEVFFALGNHGQLLWVDRARDIVVVHGTDHRKWLRASPELGQLAPLLERVFAAQPPRASP
jgi:CubicO group peptidase (beta-lactamase class C family)